MTLTFNFGAVQSTVQIAEQFPTQQEIFDSFGKNSQGACIFVCDENTLPIAKKIQGDAAVPTCVLPAGEKTKCWESVETILRSAKNFRLGRDGLFIAVGGGVISDISGFAASIYMRGAGLVIVSTTLLGMVDAAVGGKTGIDIFERKNLAGTFYPAARVYLPVEALRSLPVRQIRSGLAEVIKTAILDKDGNDEASFEKFYALRSYLKDGRTENLHALDKTFTELISDSVRIKGRIVEADPKETGTERALLNLGHTFAHALESSAGLGEISHGEAVAWGIARAAALGVRLNISPAPRAEKICRLLRDLGYETGTPHPAMKSIDLFMRSLGDDKKKKAGALRFVIPAGRGAELVQIEDDRVTMIEEIVCGRVAGNAANCV
jgi:3-dehydroquinate synthase